MVQWCIYPGCQFYTSRKLRDLERHWVEAHGARPRQPKKPESEAVPLELFPRDKYLGQRRYRDLFEEPARTGGRLDANDHE